MNQTFHFPRFLQLLRLEFAERGRKNLVIAALLVAGLLVMMLPIIFFEGFKPIFTMPPTLALFMVVLFGGSLFTIQLLGKYGPPETAIPALMVPASQLEKFLSALIIQVVFAVVLMGVFLYLHDWTTNYANSKIPEGSQKYRLIPEGPLHYTIGLYIIIQGFAFLGSVYFPKSAYVKSIITFAVVLAVLTALNLTLADFFTNYPDSLVSIPLSDWLVNDKQYGYQSIIPSESTKSFITSVPIITLIGLWLTTYFRLKEKEV